MDRNTRTLLLAHAPIATYGVILAFALIFVAAVAGAAGGRGRQPVARRAIALPEPSSLTRGSDASSFAVSPDDRWLMFAQDDDSTVAEVPEVVLRDLVAGTERTVDFESVDAPRDAARSVT